MKKLLAFSLLLVSITLTQASQPPLHPQRFKTAKVELKHRKAQELAELSIGSEDGVIVTPCWNENSVIISGPSDKLQSVITFIQTQVDVPQLKPTDC